MPLWPESRGRPRASGARPARLRARTRVDADTPTRLAAVRSGTPLAISLRPRSVAAMGRPLTSDTRKTIAGRPSAAAAKMSAKCRRPLTAPGSGPAGPNASSVRGGLARPVAPTGHDPCAGHEPDMAGLPRRQAPGQRPGNSPCVKLMRQLAHRGRRASAACGLDCVIKSVHLFSPVRAPRHAEPMR